MLTLLQTFIQDYGFERTYWLAYSGGLDSQVLLRLCVELRALHPFSFRAVHVHHGLSSQAETWLNHCKRSCDQDQVELTCLRVDAKPPVGKSLEDHARTLRYALFKELLKPGEILLTAHHQDDQAETLLLQLLRGAGLKGLSAMPKVKTFGKGLLARPLLEQARAELQTYAKEESLLWVEDELNQNLHYPRNRLRHEVLPLLKRYWPTASQTLARSAKHCAEAQALLNEVADQDFVRVAGSKPGTLSVQGLLGLSPARQRLVLRHWFAAQGVLMPNTLKLQQLQRNVLLARPDRQPQLLWGTAALRRYQDNLYLLPPFKPHDPALVYRWHLSTQLSIEGLGQLRATPGLGQGLRASIQEVEVRFRQGGEGYLTGGGKRRALKKFFQEQAIPPWERERLPLIFLGKELIAIPGYYIRASFKAAPGEEGREMQVQGLDSFF